MDRILENSPNVCNIADDIVIYGENEAENDQCIRSFMDTAKQNGLVLNSFKCEIKKIKSHFWQYLYQPRYQARSAEGQRHKRASRATR